MVIIVQRDEKVDMQGEVTKNGLGSMVACDLIRGFWPRGYSIAHPTDTVVASLSHTGWGLNFYIPQTLRVTPRFLRATLFD